MTSSTAVALLTSPVVGEPTVRADGAAVAFTVSTASLADDRRTSVVEVVDPDGRTLWSSDGPADRAPRFAPVGGLLGHASADGLRIVDLEHGSVRTIATGGTVRRWAWRHDGATVVATIARERPHTEHAPIVVGAPGSFRDGEGWWPDRVEVVVATVDDGVVATVAGPFDVAGDVAVAADGSVLLCLPAGPDTWRWDLVCLHPTSGAEQWRSRHGDWDRAAAPAALADGRVLFVGGDSGPGHARLVIATPGGEVHDVDTGLDRNVTVGVPAYPGAPPVVDGDHVVFTANDDGCSRAFRAPLAGGTSTALTDAEQAVTGLDVRSGLLVTTVATGTSPGELRTSGAVVRRHAELTLPWTVERLAVRARDGADVPAWLLRSVHATGRAPLLLDVHGGPHNASNGTLGTANLHRVMLAAQGWHVLLVNPRGSDGSGLHWYRGLEPHGGWASADLDDLLAAVDAAVADGAADPDRLAVTGYSYGGLATAALTTRTDRFRAAAMGGALVDLPTFVASSDLGPVLAARELGGTPWAPGGLAERSPLAHVDRVRTPTLVLHGTADRRCPVTQAELWFQSLQALGVPSELVLYPGAAHGFVSSGRPSWVLDAATRITDWVVRHT